MIALKSSKYINVPYYNMDTDEFLFKDGSKVANDDPIFKQYKWL